MELHWTQTLKYVIKKNAEDIRLYEPDSRRISSTVCVYLHIFVFMSHLFYSSLRRKIGGTSMGYSSGSAFLKK